ncbi:hypothetical protein [Sideroxydans lithotrophicus]|uniref:Uncharacterized protein n=1 Tax=Sideroxydans lithotrophicus (strain ES-1) TaxID=580332 RepID=D5CPJ6_SIDLE|nr:hypothetical protein [Sideroxydans lithotrophicus]ADE12991.1 hypothetical protein Slit_2766 [Sideroxydans lithotrophicus ES-1]
MKVGAVGPASFAHHVAVGSSTAGLQVQLDRYRQQLADWVTCASCNTIEGKNRIAQISARIGEVESQMKAAEDARRTSGTNGLNEVLPVDQVLQADKPGNDVGTGSAPSAVTPGSRLDIFA